MSVNHERPKENKNVMISQRKRRKRKRKKLREGNSILRDRPFNLHGFLFCSEIFFRTTRELEYLFFSEFNIRLYDKNSESDYFFSSTKIRIFFSATLGIRIFFFRKKNIAPPPWKLNSPSLNSSSSECGNTSRRAGSSFGTSGNLERKITSQARVKSTGCMMVQGRIEGVLADWKITTIRLNICTVAPDKAFCYNISWNL